MKKTLKILMCILSLSIMFVSCSEDDDDLKIDSSINYDQQNLIGKWNQGTLFYKFKTEKNDEGKFLGTTWDTKEDVTEEDAEGQPFTWELTHNNLVMLHFGGRTPKSYIVTSLTASSLIFVDQFDQSKKFNFTKVK